MPKFTYFLWNGIKIINSMIAKGTIAEDKLTTEVQEKLNSTGITDYSELSNKPEINSVELSGNKSSSDLGLQDALTAGDGINITNDVISAKDRSFEYVETLLATGSEDKYYLTKATRPTVNYGAYCFNKGYYPDSLPAITFDNNYVNFVIYNTLDNCFYLFQQARSYSGVRFNYVTVVNNYMAVNIKEASITVFKYNPETDTEWTQVFTSSTYSASTISTNCLLSDVKKFKFVWCNLNFVFKSDIDYTVTYDSTKYGESGYIYANFFNPTTGAYLENDSDHIDESNIYSFNMNVYRNSAWSVVGTFDLQDILELFAKTTDVNSALTLKLDKTAVKQSTGSSTTDVMSQDAVTTALGGKLNTNQGSENAGKFLKVASDGSIEYATIS